MASIDPKKWLLLIHQIPPKPNALRVKVWRRLKKIGAVAIKQSVYVMPCSEQSREDLSWTLREIVEGGGEGSICEAQFVEGLTDDQILALFYSARKADYEMLIHDANALLAEWSSRSSDLQAPGEKNVSQMSRLRRRLDEISAVDFFHAPERPTAELLLKELGELLSGQPYPGRTGNSDIADLVNKTWVTRENLFVDRIACGWLIRRFVDQTAVFKFVSGPHHTPGRDEIRFDMFDGEYTHEGDRCTFEVMIQRLQLQDQALHSMAEVVHDIDLKDGKYARSETVGFNALLSGLVAATRDDGRRMAQGFHLFENLYAYFHAQKR